MSNRRQHPMPERGNAGIALPDALAKSLQRQQQMQQQYINNLVGGTVPVYAAAVANIVLSFALGSPRTPEEAEAADEQYRRIAEEAYIAAYNFLKVDFRFVLEKAATEEKRQAEQAADAVAEQQPKSSLVL